MSGDCRGAFRLVRDLFNIDSDRLSAVSADNIAPRVGNIVVKVRKGRKIGLSARVSPASSSGDGARPRKACSALATSLRARADSGRTEDTATSEEACSEKARSGEISSGRSRLSAMRIYSCDFFSRFKGRFSLFYKSGSRIMADYCFSILSWIRNCQPEYHNTPIV